MLLISFIWSIAGNLILWGQKPCVLFLKKLGLMKSIKNLQMAIAVFYILENPEANIE